VASAPLARTGRFALLAPLVLLLGFALPAAPYLIALRQVTGEWRLTLKKDERHLVGIRDLQAPPPVPRPRDDLKAIVESVEGHADAEEPGSAGAALYVARRSAAAIHPLLLVLGLLGLGSQMSSRRVAKTPGPPTWRPGDLAALHGPLVLVLAAFFLAHVLLKVNEHDFTGNHAAAEAIVFAAWSGLGVAFLVDRVSRAELVARRRRLATAFAVGVAFVVLVLKTRDAHAGVKGERERAVAAWLAARAEPGRELVVCGRDVRAVAFLAGARLVELPRGDAASVARAARAAGARWLVLYVRTLGDEPAAVTSALAAAGLGAPVANPDDPFQAKRSAEERPILYTWLVYDLSEGKR
jgi:hypothetical protein